MADFDAFAASDAPAHEEDPAADFLAREQDQLAELNDDNFTGDDFGGNQPQVQAAGEDDFMAAFDPQAAQSDDLFTSQEQPVTTEDSIDPAEQEKPLSDVSQPDISVDNSDTVAPTGDSSAGDFFSGGGDAIPGLDDLDERLDQEDQQQSSDPYASVRSVDTQRKEPEKIRIWREEQKAALEVKDSDEAKKKEEWQAAARKELDDWYRHRDEQFQKAKALNRESETEFIKERDESIPGGEWEKICRLCEFNPKSNRSQKDNSRMRSILLQLKQNPSVQATA